MLASLAARVVEWCWRHAVVVVAGFLAVTVALAVYAAGHLAMDTDESKLISADLPFRQAERALDRAFPQSTDRIVVVLDAPTPDLAEEAVERLAAALAAETGVIRRVERPSEEMFFRRHGLLFLSAAELTGLSDRLIQAQPMLGAVARDPSLRGLLATLDLMLDGIAHGQAGPADIEPLIARLDAAAAAIAAGRPADPVDWQALMSAGPARDSARRVLFVQARLDFGALEAGAEGDRVIREAARRLGLVPEQGYRVRLTGSVALSDANFATVAEGVEISGPLSLLAVLGLLFWGVRSGRVVAAIMVNLLVGLVATAAFAAFAIGSLNPISVAFAVMFVGMGVDFGIQYATAFRAERHRGLDPAAAAAFAARAMAAPLSLAAVTTAVGFLSFLPTAYTGVSQLGLIAGMGMLIALVTSLTLLPALLALLKPPPEREAVGFPLAAADRWLERRARPIVAVAAVVSLGGALLLPRLPLDFDPLNLQDPKVEAVATYLDLARDRDAGVYAVDALAPSLAEARTLAAGFEALPQVLRVMTIATFVPEDQDDKLAIIADLAGILGPTLAPSAPLAPPGDEELRQRVEAMAGRLDAVAADYPPSRSLAASLRRIAETGPAAARRLDRATAAGLGTLVAGLRRSLEAGPVALDTLPAGIKGDWIAADGRIRLRVLPGEDMRDQDARRRFVEAVVPLAPVVAGPPIAMAESGKVVISAFAIAGISALAAIFVLLGLMLRRLLDSVLVVAPLLAGAMATVICAWAGGLALNFANVIALPLLLGVGVAFNIYFVVNWRNGVTGHLQSPTTRAVLFSALTTGSAFGSLAVSPHLGTASMGLLLSLSLVMTVVATFVVLPALFHLIGRPRP